MSSSSPDSSAGAERSLAHESPSDLPRAGEVSELLEEILAQTLSGSERAQTRQRLELAALVDVARQFASEGLCVHPTGEALVGAVLAGRFDRSRISDELRLAMSRQIAKTIIEDPSSRGRFMALWQQLLKMAQ